MPSPKPLVVKKGSNTRSITSGAMPAPVSDTLSATMLPVQAFAARRRARSLVALILSLPPSGIASRALKARLSSASSSAPGRRRQARHRSEVSMHQLDVACRSERPDQRRHVGQDSRRRSIAAGSRAAGARAKASSCLVRPAPRCAESADAVEHAPEPLRVAEIAAARGRSAEDHGQQIVEIVRDAAGQLAERLHLLRLEQLLARVLQPMLRFPLLGDVAGDLGEADQLALSSRIASITTLAQNRRAVLAHAPAFGFETALLARGLRAPVGTPAARSSSV